MLGEQVVACLFEEGEDTDKLCPLEIEVWKIQADAKRPHWARNMGIHTELKLILISKS